MAVINTRIVRRSQSLLLSSNLPKAAFARSVGSGGQSYNQSNEFVFHERSISKSLLAALLMWFGLLLFFVLVRIRFVRNLIEPYFPKPGGGPSIVQRAKSSFTYTMVATGRNPQGV
jgi:hypothetical protein